MRLLKELCLRIFTESLDASKTKNGNNLIVPLLCNVYRNVICVTESKKRYPAVKMDQQDLHIFIELKFLFLKKMHLGQRKQ